MRDRDPLLIKRNPIIQEPDSLISDTQLHPTVGQQIKIHFFPSRSQEVHASTIKSAFPPPPEELVVPFHWIRDVRSRSNDGINHTNNRISVSRYMYRICLKFPLWSKFTWLKNIEARVKRGNWGTISWERECKYADKLFRGTSALATNPFWNFIRKTSKSYGFDW